MRLQALDDLVRWILCTQAIRFMLSRHGDFQQVRSISVQIQRDRLADSSLRNSFEWAADTSHFSQTDHFLNLCSTQSEGISTIVGMTMLRASPELQAAIRQSPRPDRSFGIQLEEPGREVFGLLELDVMIDPVNALLGEQQPDFLAARGFAVVIKLEGHGFWTTTLPATESGDSSSFASFDLATQSGSVNPPAFHRACFRF